MKMSSGFTLVSGMKAPRGSKMSRVDYRKGVSGKQVEWIIPEPRRPRSVLFVSDSNARNLVSPCVVKPSPQFCFDFAAVSIPGGTIGHGIVELQDRAPVPRVDVVVLALGTNDVLRNLGQIRTNPGGLIRSITDDIGRLVENTKFLYPCAKVFCCGILPLHWYCEGHFIGEINSAIQQVSARRGVEFMNLIVPNCSDLWYDHIHLSDEGLHIFLKQLEEWIRPNVPNHSLAATPDKRFNFAEEFPPLSGSGAKETLNLPFYEATKANFETAQKRAQEAAKKKREEKEAAEKERAEQMATKKMHEQYRLDMDCRVMGMSQLVFVHHLVLHFWKQILMYVIGVRTL